jgi:hypothetical protein
MQKALACSFCFYQGRLPQIFCAFQSIAQCQYSIVGIRRRPPLRRIRFGAVAGVLRACLSTSDIVESPAHRFGGAKDVTPIGQSCGCSIPSRIHASWTNAVARHVCPGFCWAI